MSMKVILSCILTLFLNPLHALVDYTDSDEVAVAPRTERPAQARSVKKARRGSSASRSSGPKMFVLRSGYEMINVKMGNTNGTVNKGVFDAHFETPYDIYLDAKMWMATSSDKDLASSSDFSPGNPEFKLGLSWIRFGDPSELASVDLFAGVSIGNSGEYFATSRTDKILGVESSKRFYQFLLALNFELRLTGTPSDIDEVDIGVLQHLGGGIGWFLTPDIQLLLHGGTYRIGEGSEEREKSLRQKLSFGYVGSLLNLGISPLINIELGAVFRTKRIKNNMELLGAKLWDIKGAYGNSLYANLKFAL